MESDGYLGLLLAAGRLKRVPRTGWVRAGVPQPESVADHSYRTALAALLLAPAAGADAGRAAAMALLHDLPEAVIGDLVARTPAERADKLRREEEALASLLDGVPGAAGLRALWDEYRAGQSPEARLVASVDKLEMAIQALEEQRRNPDLDLREFLESAQGRVDGPGRDVLDRVAAVFGR